MLAVVATLEQQAHQEFDAQPIARGSRLKKPLIAGVVTVNLAAIGGVAYGIMNLAPGASAPPAAEEQAAVAEAASAPSAKKESVTGVTVKLEPFVVNLTDAERPRYLKVDLTLTVQNDKAKREIETRDADVRNAVIAYLSGLTPAQTVGPLGKSDMGFALKNKINSVLPDDTVERVLFTQFIVH